MASLYKKEVLVRPSSTISVQGAIDWTHNWLDTTFQEVSSNKDTNGDYIDYFFADIFDARTGNIYRVFTNACKSYYSMTEVDFELLNTSNFAKATDVDAIQTQVSDNGDRIVALENQDTTTQAVVI